MALSLSPLVLPTTRYALSPSSIAGSASIALTASAVPVTGAVQAAHTVAFSAVGNVFGRAVAIGAEPLAFSNTGNLTARAVAKSSPSLDWTATGLVQATGSLQATPAISFTAGATAQTGTLSASASVGFSQAATVLATGSLLSSQSIEFTAFGAVADPDLLDVGSWVLPIARYRFSAGDPIAQGSASFGFSQLATLTGTASFPSNLQAATSIAEIFNLATWLQGKGELKATGSIAFATNAKVTNNKLLSAVGFDFSQSATVTAKGQLQGSTSVGFSEAADIILIKSIQGSASVDISNTGGLLGTTGKLKAATVIRFINPGSLLAPVFGSTSFGITATATLADGTVIVIPEPAEVRLTALPGTVRAKAIQDVMVRAESIQTEVKLWRAA